MRKEGDVIFNGQPLNKRLKRQMGFVLQVRNFLNTPPPPPPPPLPLPVPIWLPLSMVIGLRSKVHTELAPLLDGHEDKLHYSPWWQHAGPLWMSELLYRLLVCLHQVIDQFSALA